MEVPLPMEVGICRGEADIEPPWQAIKEWIPDEEPDLDWFNRPRNPSNSDPDSFDQSPGWKPEEVQLDDGRTLVLEYT
jgi:hypothetical protein